MSDFNTANDLAAELVWGRTYQGDEPCFKPTKIVFHGGLDSEERVVIEDDGKSDWPAVASRIQALLGQGYHWTTLPCRYCGATEFEDVLHCDECGEPILHGYERASIDEDGEQVTYCDVCYEPENKLGAAEEPQ
jgi:formylmethanofuran dehydrogenase subunit E